jgi:hypothetical protein
MCLILHECIVADFWACAWGYSEALAVERVKSRGCEYTQLILEWQNGEDLFMRLYKWQAQRLSGV